MSFGKLMSDFRGVCGIKGCRGCSQEFGIDKDVWERVRLWWREVSCPPPRACNSGFSSITPCPSSLCCPLTPLILSRSASAKFLNHELSVGFFVVVSCRLLLCRYPYKLFFFFLWFWQTSLDIVLLLSYFSFLCLHLSLPVSAITLVLITLYFSSRWVPLWLCSVYSVLPRPPPMVMIYECFYSRYVCLTVTYQGEIPPPSSSFPYGLFFFFTDPNCQLQWTPPFFF